MDAIDIQAQLKRRKVTQRDIAEAEGVSGTAISQIINRRAISDRLMKAIAARLEKPVTFIFDDYYSSNIRRRRKAA
jgi:transcriptional regulator with XRE-family HTH domain